MSCSIGYILVKIDATKKFQIFSLSFLKVLVLLHVQTAILNLIHWCINSVTFAGKRSRRLFRVWFSIKVCIIVSFAVPLLYVIVYFLGGL